MHMPLVRWLVRWRYHTTSVLRVCMVLSRLPPLVLRAAALCFCIRIITSCRSNSGIINGHAIVILHMMCLCRSCLLIPMLLLDCHAAVLCLLWHVSAALCCRLLLLLLLLLHVCTCCCCCWHSCFIA